MTTYPIISRSLRMLLLALLGMCAGAQLAPVQAARASRATAAIWVHDVLYDTVLTDTRFTSPPLRSTDVIFSFADSGLDGQRSVAQYAPGDAEYNGGRWTNARQAIEQTEFWETFHACTHRLPKRTARVFLLREVDGWETDSICRELNVNAAHLFVMLHRARLALRRCLELNWFGGRRRRK